MLSIDQAIEIQIQKRERIESPTERESLWLFYQKAFLEINENTPISQTLPKHDFINWMSNPNILKYVVSAKNGIVALGIMGHIAEDVDWLLSQAYFHKHYPGKQVYVIPAIAIEQEDRGSMKIVVELLKTMCANIPEDGMVVFLYSEKHNCTLPRHTERIFGNKADGAVLDSETCYVYTWKQSSKTVTKNQ